MRYLPLIVVCAVACDGSVPAPARSPEDVAQPPDAAVDVAPDAGPEEEEVVVPGLPEVWVLPPGEEGSEATCTNGVDDDQNGFTDCDDHNCTDNVYTWVCGALENGPERCTDGQDNPETPAGHTDTDGLVDCADPDCAKNPFLGVCPVAAPEGWGSGGCDDGTDDDGDGSTDCDDLDCLLAPGSACGDGGRARVLFDQAHGQTAGSADWIVDVAQPFPRPSQPASEDDWAGSYSAVGVAAVTSGDFVVLAHHRTDPPLRLGDGSLPDDLSRVAVLVLAEPSSRYEDAEIDAIAAFVQAGGGLLLIGNHAGADRDNNGVDAVIAFNEMLTRFGGGGTLDGNPLGLWFEAVYYEEAQALDEQTDGVASRRSGEPHPVLSGPGGEVEALGMFVGTTLGLLPGGPARGLVWVTEEPGAHTGAYAVAATWGEGRVVAIGDSAALSDPSDSHGVVFGSSGLDAEDDRAFALNALAWLAGRE